VGYIGIAISRKFVFDWPGLIGGGMWALGNTMSMPCIRLIGLGVGILTWSATNMVAGYFYGRFGAFGLEKEKVNNQYFSALGIIFAIAALIMFVWIKPTIENVDEDEESTDKNKTPHLLNPESGGGYGSINVKASDTPSDGSARRQQYSSNSDYESSSSEVENGEDKSFLKKKAPEDSPVMRILSPFLASEVGKRIVGVIMALVSGLLYSASLVPFSLWKQKNKDAGSLDYLFTLFSGIYIMSTVVFCIYCLLMGTPKINARATIASYICGVLWAIAMAGMMVATAKLGFTVGYPISGIGPILVTSLWSVIWFREIRGRKNAILLSVAFVFIIIGIAFLVLSR